MESISLAVNGLELSTTSFCSDFLQNLPTVQEQKKTAADQLRRLDDRLLIVLSKLRYAANAIAPPNKLPPEVLRAIFSHLCPETRRDWRRENTPPYADLLAIGRVCRHWREISVSATELWTHIILAGGRELLVSEEEQRSIARLCMRRSGVQPLDFFYTISASELPNPQELIPDRRRLRSLVYRFRYSSGDELVSFLLPPSRLERLEIRGDQGLPLPTLPSDIAPLHLQELAIWESTPWPNHQFGSLTSLGLLEQGDMGANIHSLLDALRCSPRLEELVLERIPTSIVELQQPPENNVLAVPLRSLRRLHVCRVSVETTRRLLGALDLSPNGIFMRFTNVSGNPGDIFPETITPELSPYAATKVELIYPPEPGVIIHATNGVAYTRLVSGYRPRFVSDLFDRITKNPHGEYPLKELWLHIDRDDCYGVPPPRYLRDLETLCIEVDCQKRNNGLDNMLFSMLSPTKYGVPSPHLSTLQLWGLPNVAMFGEVLKARSGAGSRLKTLRIRWFRRYEARVAPLVQFVDKLEFYRVSDETSRGLELPEECMTRRRWWEPWYRRFVGAIECKPREWGGMY